MKKIFAIIGLLPLFTGCFFTTPDSRFYMLENTKNPAVVSDKKINIAVQDVNFPQYLDRPQSVVQSFFVLTEVLFLRTQAFFLQMRPQSKFRQSDRLHSIIFLFSFFRSLSPRKAQNARKLKELSPNALL